MSFIAAAGTALATGAGAAVAGKLLGGGGGGTSIKSGTTTTAPPDYIKSQYEDLASEITNLQTSGQFGQFQELTPEQIALAQEAYKLAQAGTVGAELVAPAAQQLVTGELFDPAIQVFGQFTQPQDYMTGVGFQQALQSTLNPEIERITSQFQRGGRGGSGAFAQSYGRGISEAASPFVYKSQQDALNRQMDAAKMLAVIGTDKGKQMALGIEAIPVASEIAFGDISNALFYQDLLAKNQFMKDTEDVRAAKERAELIKLATVGETTTAPLYAQQQQAGPDYFAGARDEFSKAVTEGLLKAGSSVKDYFAE